MELDADPEITAGVTQPDMADLTFEKLGWAYDVRWPTRRRLPDSPQTAEPTADLVITRYITR